MVNQRIAELLAKAESSERVFPATDLYNEGWMLRLLLDWLDRNRDVEFHIRFSDNSRWYSEALLPSAFLARRRGDRLAESWTHADGVIGQFTIGENADGDLSLKKGATQLVVTEAKMFSKLSAGVTNAKYFNQAARNVACIAEVIKRSSVAPSSFDDIGFYVVAPKIRIEEGVFSKHVDKDDIRETVKKRVLEYEDDDKKLWYEEWFIPTLKLAKVRCISWEEILAVVAEHNPPEGEELSDFYSKCFEFNKFMAKRYALEPV